MRYGRDVSADVCLSDRGTQRARHELWIALAGPAVNVVIALLLYAVLAAAPGPPVTFAGMRNASPLVYLLWANVALVLFNLDRKSVVSGKSVDLGGRRII